MTIRRLIYFFAIETVLIIVFSVHFLSGQDNYQEWLKKDQQAYLQFLEKEDRDFMEFLKKDWEAFESMQGIKSDVKPKPKVMPVAKPKPLPEETKTPVEPVKIIPQPAPPPPPKPAPERLEPEANIKCRFYNIPLGFIVEKIPELNLGTEISNESISNGFAALAASELSDIIIPLKKYQSLFQVNDWGYLQMTNLVSKELYKDKNQQTLCMWFLLMKSEYDAHVAYKRNEIFLLLPNQNMIYNNQFVTLSNQKYYFVTFSGAPDLSGQVFTYEGKYKEVNKIPTLRIDKVPNLSNDVQNRNLKFEYQGNTYTFAIEYNKDMVDFFKTYPQTEISLYFKSPVSSPTQQTLVNSLKPHLQGKSELEAVNFLLHFVQTAFDYKTDDVQFGIEKYLLPEETIFYPSSDCEDRSIFFAYLVKNLLGLEIVALDYPGHIATAIHFSSEIAGDKVAVKGKKYIICDPTYINANAGMCMPEYQSVNPEIIYF